MILDFNPTQQTYILRVSRASAYVLRREHGFNFSQPESWGDTALMYTKDPFCAASFASYASPAAAAQLDWIGREIEASSALDSGRHLTLPPDKELMGFQRAGVDYILNRQHALDGDEPGLGKTPTSIAVANEMQAKRIIVVCPASILAQWLRRIKEWSTIPKMFCYPISQRHTSETANWTIISYERARDPAILRSLVKQRFDLLIVDEAHFTKDISAKRVAGDLRLPRRACG